MLQLNINKLKSIIILAISLLISFLRSDCQQYLLASEIMENVPFTAKHFSVYVNTKEWALIKQKNQSPSEDPDYIRNDIGNALSDPIIGKGSERILIIPEDDLSFKNKGKDINLSVSCWPIALWQIKDKTREQLANSIRDAYLLITHSGFTNIKTCDIRYFKNEINKKPFFSVSYVSDGETNYGFISYATGAITCYISDDLRKRYWFSASHYDNKKPMDKSVLENYLDDFIRGFQLANTDKDSEYLDYIIYSATSLYMALRQRRFFEEKDKQPLSIYKIPVNIEEEGKVKRRILKDDFLDIREFSIEERLSDTINLLKEAAKKYFNDPRIYYGLGLLYEFNNLGERYGEGFLKTSAEEAYQNALSIDSAFSPARYNLAILYIRGGDLDKGISELNKLITEKKGEDVEVYCALAYSYEKKNNLVLAVDYYKSALNSFTGKQKQAASDEFKMIKEKIKQLSKI